MADSRAGEVERAGERRGRLGDLLLEPDCRPEAEAGDAAMPWIAVQRRGPGRRRRIAEPGGAVVRERHNASPASVDERRTQLGDVVGDVGWKLSIGSADRGERAANAYVGRRRDAVIGDGGSPELRIRDPR
jgi:hypothetical protein